MTESREVRRIQEQLRRALEGGAWHGPALHEIVGELTAEEAARRPVAAAHSPWEIVAHIAAWLEIVARRLAGETVEPTEEEDWPPVAGGDEGWSRTRERADAAHRALQRGLDALADSDLGRQVPGQTYSNYVMLHGAVQHTLYHAGQLALLRKAVRAQG